VPEPTGPLWQRVRAHDVEWPGTDEGVVAALAEDWGRARTMFHETSRHDVSAVRGAWADDVGGAYVTKAGTTVGHAGTQAQGMASLAIRTAAFAGEVSRVKTGINDHVAANEPLFTALGNLPAGIAEPFQDFFAAQVAANVNQMINDGAGRVTAMGDEDEESLLDWLNEQGGDFGSWVGETAGDFGSWVGEQPGKIGSWIGEQAADLGDGIRELLDGDDSRLDAAVDPDVDVDAITPDPVWRDTDEPLFRSDDRSPDEIFEDGLEARNSDNVDLESHVFLDRPSAFVASTTNEDLYKHPEYRDRDYRYVIHAPGGIDVNTTLPDARTTFPGEDEIAFPGGVDPRFISGAHEVNPDGTLGRWIPNPDFDPN
jgi:hypothetical protein